MGKDDQETTVVKEDTTTTTTTVDEQEMKDASDSKDADSSNGSKHPDEPEDAELEDANANDESDDKKEEAEKPKEKETEEKEETEEEKQKREELKKKYANWPLKNIKEPHDNDVMYGRGGGTNHHPGNKVYRKLVEDKKLDYVNSKRLDKPLVALHIIRTWRTQVPPGRFLKMDEKMGLWNDVGDKKAREKTSQALREKAPLIRKQQEDERKEDGEEEDEPKVGETKTTRFAEGTKKESNLVKKAVLARDHSLGREYLQAGEAVSLEGFSWQDPFKRESSYGSQSDPASSLPAPPPPAASYPPAGRNSSHGSLGMAPAHRVSSAGGPPPPPDYYGRLHSDDRQRQFSSGRYESWGTPYAYPPPPPEAHGPHHQRSGSWTQGPPSPLPHGAHHQRSGSWTHAPPLRSGSWTSGREHSLSAYPLVGASVSQAGASSAFDSSRSGSGYWGEPMTTTTSMTRSPPPPPPPGPYGGPHGPYRSPSNSVTPPPNNNTPSPQYPYHVDPSIASQWSGGEVKRTWSGDQEMRRSYSREYDEHDDRPAPYSSAANSPMRSGGDSSNNNNNLPRPNMVKRDTSNQNETYETKPSIKRAALNRDNSAATNRLKEQYMPEFYNNGKFDTEQEMRTLSDNLELSTLDTPGGRAGLRPRRLKDEERVSTIDAIAMDLMVKPSPLLDGNRTTTIDALDLVLDDDPIIHPSEIRREESREERIADLKREVPKPNTLTAHNRLTTLDFLDIVAEPDDPTIHPSEMRREESREEHIADLKRGVPKPNTLTADNRLTTLDFLDIVAAPDDPTIHPSEMRREESREEHIADLKRGVPKPNTLTADNRLTTKDFLDIVNEPLAGI